MKLIAECESDEAMVLAATQVKEQIAHENQVATTSKTSVMTMMKAPLQKYQHIHIFRSTKTFNYV